MNRNTLTIMTDYFTIFIVKALSLRIGAERPEGVCLVPAKAERRPRGRFSAGLTMHERRCPSVGQECLERSMYYGQEDGKRDKK